MTDLVLDTSALADFLAQYFQSSARATPCFRPSTFLVPDVTREINRIVDHPGEHVIAASAMAFVEIAHLWNRIVSDRFTPQQLWAFLTEPPEWFTVEPIDTAIVPHFARVPAEVIMPEGQLEPIEWTDAVHAATVLGRDNAALVTADQRLAQITQIRVIKSRR